MTVGCTCHDSLLFSKDLAWCSDTFRLVAGKDHVGNPWKSIVCMYNITCIWYLSIQDRHSAMKMYKVKEHLGRNSMKTGFHRSWRRWSSSDLWVWERCMSFMRVSSVQACDDAFTPPFQFLNCWEKHGETVLTQTCQCHTWVKNMNRLQCVSQHFQPCSATKRSWVRRMDL